MARLNGAMVLDMQLNEVMNENRLAKPPSMTLSSVWGGVSLASSRYIRTVWSSLLGDCVLRGFLRAKLPLQSNVARMESPFLLMHNLAKYVSTWNFMTCTSS